MLDSHKIKSANFKKKARQRILTIRRNAQTQERTKKGLGYRRKFHRPGKCYHHQSIPDAGPSHNPVHTFSGHPFYTTAAYAESKLLPSGAKLQEIIVNPGLFI